MHHEYVLGLVDGEGSFTVYIRNPLEVTARKRRVLVEPKFYIKLAEGDKDILYTLQKFFSCGNIYFQKDSRPNHQHCYRYEVSKRDDLREVIIPFFRKHSLRFPSKQRDFLLFCRLFRMIEQGIHKTKNGLEKMYRIKQRMH
ncbi:hypothetical protein A3A21_03575 [Candidatus Jorgensenbacteria bacterium RIFCSPLOWO2_01_FULL_45_25b]|uniref:Homing endonuclease LAGLIDADG domain-containing protein n=1 Tax=Candidatus Jorgensenbacteria bacterium RIFCSPLOWO2_01_FULL_45_25b TaxID=1798471 RepID=A0A1F6BYR1_9BACT|nr:MAG: hypothetical protein A3A21_03575 [Candidatus Jorgensenbacteria bacterium RIFCSPLOWO2_01_FULL_45_25b]